MKNVKSEKGMMTVEVVVGLTIYIAFFIVLLNVLNVLYLRQKFQAALKPIALEISREYATESVLNYLEEVEGTNASEQFIELQRRNFEYSRGTTYSYEYTEQVLVTARNNLVINVSQWDQYGLGIMYLKDTGVVGGFGGLSLDQSTIDLETGEVDLILTYQVRVVNLPFFNGAGIDINIEQHACTSLWM